LTGLFQTFLNVGESARVPGPDLWTDVVAQETAGDREIVELGDFDCTTPRSKLIFGNGFESAD
jgi:hypothetical protein